jgi:hypothetical protein
MPPPPEVPRTREAPVAVRETRAGPVAPDATRSFTPDDPVARLGRGAREVAREAITILRHPHDFTTRLSIPEARFLARGSRFLVGCVPVLFLLLLPVHLRHGRVVTQPFVVILLALSAYTFGPALHLSTRLFGGRPGRLGATIGLYAWQLGMQAVASVLLYYPVSYRYGAQVLFTSDQQVVTDLVLHASPREQQFLALNVGLATTLLAAWFLFGWVPMWRHHFFRHARFGWLRAFGAQFVIFATLGVVQPHVLPLLYRIADVL